MADAAPSLPPASSKKIKPKRNTSYPMKVEPAKGPPPPEPDFDTCRKLLDVSIEKTKTEMELVFEANDAPNNKMIIFRKRDEKSGAYFYRMKGVVPYPISSFIGTQGNLQYKEHWNEFCESIQYVDRTGSSELTRWVIKFPFPFSNREYLYRNWIRIEPSPSGSLKSGPTYLMMGGVFPQDDHRVARSSSLVRVETCRVQAAARPAGDKACEIVLESLDDPQMTIPKWLFNWFVKTGIPRMRTSLDEAASGYAAYMATYECDFDESKYLVKVADTKDKVVENSTTQEAAAESVSTSKASDTSTSEVTKDS